MQVCDAVVQQASNGGDYAVEHLPSAVDAGAACLVLLESSVAVPIAVAFMQRITELAGRLGGDEEYDGAFWYIAPCSHPFCFSKRAEDNKNLTQASLVSAAGEWWCTLA
jgi:hypothetical protein